MRINSFVSVALLALMMGGCATSDDSAAVGRAVVDTGLVAASVAGYGSPGVPNCELQSSEYDRGVCIQRNTEIEAARAKVKQPVPTTSFELEDSSDKGVVKLGVTR